MNRYLVINCEKPAFRKKRREQKQESRNKKAETRKKEERHNGDAAGAEGGLVRGKCG